jgi:hypothetical protein
MAYLIRKVISNGYRCGCCQRDWERSDWTEDRADALSRVPTKLPEERDPDYELHEIEVKDGATGRVIAEGKLSYHGARGIRSSQYNNQVWRGFIEYKDAEDILAFEDVKTDVPGETWADALVRINKEIEESRLAKAKAELEAAQKKLDALTKK